MIDYVISNTSMSNIFLHLWKFASFKEQGGFVAPAISVVVFDNLHSLVLDVKVNNEPPGLGGLYRARLRTGRLVLPQSVETEDAAGGLLLLENQ